MTPHDLLAALRRRGLSITVESGQLLVSPRSAITPDDVAAIKASRDALVELVCGRDDRTAVADAMADRAWRDEPDWSGGVALRESVILRHPDYPPVCVSSEEAAGLDVIVKWNRDVRARRK